MAIADHIIDVFLQLWTWKRERENPKKKKNDMQRTLRTRYTNRFFVLLFGILTFGIVIGYRISSSVIFFFHRQCITLQNL